MMRWVNNRSVGAKLASNVVLMVLGLFLISGAALYLSYDQMMRDRKADLKGAVEIASGYAASLEAEVTAGHLTRDQALAEFASLSLPIRYNGTGFFVAYSNTGMYLFNAAKPSDAGTDGSKLVDKSGRHFVQDAIELIKRQGAGFYKLDYPKPGTTEPVPKLNYAKGLPAWNMIIVSGAFIDDLDAALMDEAMVFGLIAVPILLICLFGSLVVRQSLGGGLRKLAIAMSGLAGGDLSVLVPGLSRRDEIGGMAGAVQVFQDGLKHARELEAKAADASEQASLLREKTDADRTAIAGHQQAVVTALADGLSRLADGDLTCAIPEPFDKAYERLRHDFNTAVAQLGDAVGHIVTSTQAITSGAGEITAAADDFSRRSEQQAATLEQTAAALDEITVTVRKTAAGAQNALKIVSDAHVGCGEIGPRHAGRRVCDGGDRRIGHEGGADHRRDRRDRVPDQPSGAECRRGGRSGRAIPGVGLPWWRPRCGRWRSAVLRRPRRSRR